MLVCAPVDGGSLIDFGILRIIADFLNLLWAELGVWMIVYLLLLLLIGIAYLVFSTLLVYFCITVGAMLVKRAKLLLSIGIYYALTSALGTLWQLIFSFCGPYISTGINVLISDSQSCAILVMLVIFAALATVTSILYAITQYLLDRRLNLS